MPEAVQQVRAVRRTKGENPLVAISGADPLNLVGITSPGQRVPAIAANRVVYCGGVPVAARVGGASLSLVPSQPLLSQELEHALRDSATHRHK